MNVLFDLQKVMKSYQLFYFDQIYISNCHVKHYRNAWIHLQTQNEDPDFYR